MTHTTDPLQRLLERHVDFWTRAGGSPPLIARMPPQVWAGKPYPIRDGRRLERPTPIAPDDIDTERLLGLDQPLIELTVGDLLNSVGCVYPQAWMGSVIGCSIHASAFGVVAKPANPKIGVRAAIAAFSFEQALRSAWLSVMDAILERAEAFSCGRRAVRQLHLRGVVDMLAAYLGEERLCYAVNDCPGELAALADRFADLHIAVARRVLQRRKPWRDGYVSSWYLYAPGPLLDYQLDASNLFSPRMYRQHFLAYDRKVLGEFPYSITHLHALGLHQLDGLLTAPEVKGIQISLDRETGVWEKARVLACCQRIQRHGKSLMIHGQLDDAELDEFLSALDPRGLAIMAFADGAVTPAPV